MPTYEYLCKSCGHEFDHFQSMSDKPLKKCPKCAKKVTRLMGAGSGVLFKGSGFYETDYKRPPDKKPEANAEKPKPENTKAEKPKSKDTSTKSEKK